MRKLVWILAFMPGMLFSQIGGRNIFDFVNLSPAARVASLGGSNISTYDYDQNFAYQNPALVNDSMHNQVAFSIVNYLSDITYGYTSYARSIEGVADFHTGLQYVSYGKMIQADEFGNQLGEFSAGDFAWVVGASRQFDRFRGGVNLKVLNSSIRGFQSHWGLGLDMGGTYISENERFTAGMVFKNIGFSLTRHNLPDGERAAMPFEVQIGITHRLEHMPLRFSVTAVQLNRPSLIYVDPDPEIEFDLSGEPIEQKKPTIDNIFRHFVFGAEFLLSKNFNLRAGYNHQRRQELRAANRAGLSGFSFGAGIKIYKFRLDYSLASFHAVGPTHFFSIASNLGDFRKKEQ